MKRLVCRGKCRMRQIQVYVDVGTEKPRVDISFLFYRIFIASFSSLLPAMQEEVLKLVLLALEDGSALSRKVLVMFVVQRLEPHFPQASKTSIGHVVQLLYRASCFKV